MIFVMSSNCVEKGWQKIIIIYYRGVISVSEHSSPSWLVVPSGFSNGKQSTADSEGFCCSIHRDTSTDFY